jgi:hypothetical protein
MPTAEEALESTPLGRTINDVSDKRIRAVLKSICAQNDEARKEAESQLLVAATYSDKSSESSESNKRQRSRFAFCENCEKEFDVTTNTEESCRYHPGMTAQSGDRVLPCSRH